MRTPTKFIIFISQFLKSVIFYSPKRKKSVIFFANAEEYGRLYTFQNAFSGNKKQRKVVVGFSSHWPFRDPKKKKLDSNQKPSYCINNILIKTLHIHYTINTHFQN